MAKRLYAASEIAAMGLPGLPQTKSNVILRAEKEGWYFEERTGLGGVRRVYEIPAQYLGQAAPKSAVSDDAKPSSGAGKVVGTTVAGSASVDLELLTLVERTLDEWAEGKGLRFKPERRAAVVAFLYDYLAKGGGAEGLQLALKALAA